MNKEFLEYAEALALKELGFDEICFGRFNNGDDHLLIAHTEKYVASDGLDRREFFILAPLYQQAFRWFREKHNFEYEIKKSANGNYYVTIHKNTQEYLDTIASLPNACFDQVVDCYSYEEAELECLRKLIEIVKNAETENTKKRKEES